jgi:hypothetical protein
MAQKGNQDRVSTLKELSSRPEHGPPEPKALLFPPHFVILLVFQENASLGCAWWSISIIPALQRLRTA